jgi:HD superfamily phosphodiesterase
MPHTQIELHKLVNIDSTEELSTEIRMLVKSAFPGVAMPLFERCYEDTLQTFQGRRKGYQKCKTEYHDLRHTLDVLLATARLLHACVINGQAISSRGAELALMAALMHDIGYIQEEGENGTGGQYTLVHVERSAAFFKRYGRAVKLADADLMRGCCMITATSLAISLDSIHYPDEETELLAKLLATADLLGQLADRLYLEKLFFLFREFNEAGILGATHEFDLLFQTRNFYAVVQRRLEEGLGGLNRLMHLHFREHWHIDRDLYEESIALNINYLDHVIKEHKEDYRSRLKRGGIVERLTQHEAAQAA